MPQYKGIAVNEKIGAFVPVPNPEKTSYAVFSTQQEAEVAAQQYATSLNQATGVEEWKGFFEAIFSEEETADPPRPTI